MPATVSITLDDVYTLFRALALSVLPINVQVVKGIPNRAATPPPVPGYVSMTVTANRGLRTPVDTWDLTNPNPTVITIEQGMQLRIQLDCYGADSAQWAVLFVTLLRNDFGVKALAPVAPLYADDPIQAALVNGEEQYEQRWIVGANLQYNPTVTIPMQFANQAGISLINVDESYPP